MELTSLRGVLDRLCVDAVWQEVAVETVYTVFYILNNIVQN